MAARRSRSSDEEKRPPLAESVPRPVKRAAGRTTAALVPANIRADGVELQPGDRAYVRDRLGRKLGKFAAAMERVSVRFQDVNGPRGGVDQICRIKVVLTGLPSVVVESQAASARPAFDVALGSAERAVRRGVQRRRMKPLRTSGDRRGG